MAIDVLIADEHALLSAALRVALEAVADLNIVGETNCSQEGLMIARELEPDVLIINVDGSDASILPPVRCLAKECPGVRLVLLIAREDQALVRAGVEAGVAGLVAKHATLSDLVAAIQATARGDLYVHPALTRALLNGGGAARKDTAPGIALTPRETDVLRLLAHGYTNRQVADHLCLSVRTVETHRARLRAKLAADGRADLVHRAVERRLL